VSHIPNIHTSVTQYLRSNSFPVETLLDIFVNAAGDYMNSRSRYLDTLQHIARVCKRWYQIVYSFSDIWATYEISPHRKKDDVFAWIKRMTRPGLSLDLYLRFDDLFSFRYQPSTPDTPRLGPIGTIGAIRPLLWKARRIFISCDQYNFPTMVEALRLTYPSRLVSLTLNRVVLQQLSRIQPAHSAAPNLFFEVAVPMLRFLRVIGTTPGWDDLRLFELLEIFVAHGIPYGVRPSGLQLFRILETMRLVKRMSLRDVCYRPLPFTFHHTSIMPQLVELDVYFKSSIALAQVLARFAMPALRTVTTYFDTPQDLECLLICSGLLAGITSFAVTCNAKISRTRIGDLWAVMPQLRQLDLSRCGGEFFDTLFSPGMPYIFPLLRELALNAISPIYVRFFLQLRHDAGIPIRMITLWRIDAEYFELDIQWLLYLIGAANVIINPTGLAYTRSWILHH
jgi:hypothetical protein